MIGLSLRYFPAQDVYRRERLQRRHVATAGQHDVRLAALIVARPFPNANTRRALFDRRVQIEPLRRRLLAGDNDVDIVAAAQAVISD